MSKNVFIQDADGNAAHFDVSQVKAREINRWNGWICSAGTNVIHISRDGEVYAGTCKVGGKLGDIYNGWKNVPDWITCTVDRCNCGTQIKLPKYKPGHKADLEANRSQQWASPEQGEFDPTNQTFVDHIGDLDIHVQWSLGRRCNYDCSYCPAGEFGIHNDFEEHKPFDVLIRTVDQLHEWANGKTLMFCFSGGEPTIHPNFIEFCQYIHHLGHKIHLTTNGSHGPNYWKKIVPYLTWVLISVHFEHSPLRVLAKNLEVLKDYKRDVNEHLMVGLQIMTKPDDWDKAQSLLQDLRESDPQFFQYVETHLTALRVMLGVIQDLMDYTPEQIEQFGVVTE